MLNLFLEGTGKTDPENFQGVCMEDIALSEDIMLKQIFFRYNIDIVDESMVGEIARRSVVKQSNIVRLLRYDGHTCYVSSANNNVLFKVYRCPSCDEFIDRVLNL